MPQISLSRLAWPRILFWLLLLIACLTILPFLGLADFHTKGEPREAVVAYSMLESGNWILPTNNGGEIPYKPPFFHWVIAAVSAVAGGVSEFTSRLPSALALIAMTLMGYLFYARRKGAVTGFLAAIVGLTAFELHRAGANTRVDMMLTAMTVGSLYLLYRWYEKGLRGVPWLAILLMSCGTLTKGPVGSVIPCLTFGVFLLLRGVNFFRAFLLLAAWGAMSLILPLCWYWAAWHQGGQEFLDLVMEENFGRMTSTMSYDSCVNPWHYNFLTLAGGYVPWILLALISLFSWRKIRNARRAETADGSCASDGSCAACNCPFKRLWAKVKAMDPVDLFSLVSILVIFLFYCFPQSKRSVYLMPIYPFIGYFLARYMLWLVKIKSKALKVYGSVLAVLGLVLTAAFVAVKCGAVPESAFHGRSAEQSIAMMHEIASLNGFGWVLVALPVVLAAGWFVMLSRCRDYSRRLVWGICALTFGLYMAIDGAYQPRVLNAKSQRGVAAEVDAMAPASAGTTYEFIAAGEFAAGDPVHFFEINYYLGDRIGNFRRSQPSEGFLLIPEGDVPVYLPQFEADGYRFTYVGQTSREVIFHQRANLYRFTR